LRRFIRYKDEGVASVAWNREQVTGCRKETLAVYLEEIAARQNAEDSTSR
jgi:hypothetical protein